MPDIELRASQYEPTLGGNYLYTARFEVTQLSGVGGFHAPHIAIPLTFRSLWQGPDPELIVCDLACKLSLGADPGKFDNALSHAVSIGRHSSGSQFNVSLMLPLSPYSLERIEDFRNGRDLDLSLSLECNVFVRSPSTERLMAVDKASGTTGFQIPRSHWVDKALPGMGYLTRHIVELDVPASGELGQPFHKALKEFKDAEREFRSDNYDGVLVNCRSAIDAIASAFQLDLTGGKASYSNRVEAFRKQHLEPRTGATKAELVADHLVALWGPLSAATKPGHFTGDRPAAKYVLTTTANLLTYLGKIFA